MFGNTSVKTGRNSAPLRSLDGRRHGILSRFGGRRLLLRHNTVPFSGWLEIAGLFLLMCLFVLAGTSREEPEP
jgi:hypothetical protein